MAKTAKQALIAKLKSDAERCFRGALKEWPHHAAHSRRVGRELLAEVAALEKASK